MSQWIHVPHVPLVNAPPYGAATPVEFALADPGGSAEPVTVDEASDWLELTTDLEDTKVALLIAATRLSIEQCYDLALIQRTCTATYRGPAAYLDLPVRPFGTVATVVVTDLDGTDTSYATAALDVRHGRVRRADGGVISTHPRDTIVATYSAGYADGTVPESVTTAMRLLARDLYENRSTIKLGTVVARMPEQIDRLMYGFGRVTV